MLKLNKNMAYVYILISEIRRRGRLPTVGGDIGISDVAGHASPTLASPLRSPPYQSGPSGYDDNPSRCMLFFTM